MARGRAEALAAMGWVLGTAAPALLVAGVASLGPSLTPYPKPTEGSTLRERRAYRLVRHPIYGGFVLLGIGWSLLMSPLALVPTALLFATFELKSRFEETLLAERYPG